ncbi:MAG: glycosyltransferase [Lachnospiraceae bacterium]|nr:glycosyltransferase [Lachnospiraceae bacterium]
MSISAAMIIKRGECEKLHRCLASIHGIVSEIVAVVDPSPMDGDTTDEILFEYGAKEIFLPWPKDYAAARNAGLKQITGDWVLMIDTDEYIKVFDFDENKADRDVYRVVRENEYVSEDNALQNTERITRLFRSGLFHFEGKVHEQVTADDGKPYAAGNANIILGHTGYVDQEQMLKKSASYRELLFKMIEEDGDDPYVYFQIGRTFYVEKDYENAASAFEKAIDAGADTKDEYVESLLETYGYSLIETGRSKDAMSLTGFEEYADSADYQFLCGLIYMNNALFDDAIAHFTKATECSKVSVAGTDSYISWYNCGVINEVLGDTQKAASYYKKAGSYEPALKGLKRLS